MYQPCPCPREPTQNKLELELIFVIAALVLYLWTKELFPKFFLFPQEEPTKDKHDKFGEALAKYLRER
jgi:hypothetical protein